ncbi:MAG: hypothetical protein HY566_02815 [Candidatus Kerfeldbacteria bacterium]|nr:hypothetical protein [Candidatus Kerfeldbacteria bacterium]
MKRLTIGIVATLFVGAIAIAVATAKPNTSVATTWGDVKCAYHPDQCGRKGNGYQLAAVQVEDTTWSELKCKYHPTGCGRKGNG